MEEQILVKGERERERKKEEERNRGCTSRFFLRSLSPLLFPSLFLSLLLFSLSHSFTFSLRLCLITSDYIICKSLFIPSSSLAIDPLLDDKYYKGTKAVIEASPLPETIRVVDAEYSPDPMADQDGGDIIKVRRVEVQEHPERGRERVN